VSAISYPKYITERVKTTKMMTVKIIKPTPAQVIQLGIGSYGLLLDIRERCHEVELLLGR
jgi:hypothetical protein